MKVPSSHFLLDQALLLDRKFSSIFLHMTTRRSRCSTDAGSYAVCWSKRNLPPAFLSAYLSRRSYYGHFSWSHSIDGFNNLDGLAKTPEIIPALDLTKASTNWIFAAGIYTSTVPLLWSVSSRFTIDKSKNFKLLTIILAVIGLVVGIGLPFSKLVNIVYVINGYVGILLLALMFVRSIRNISNHKESTSEEIVQNQ